jgi:transcriptional regulator with XRE-family HTH domain
MENGHSYLREWRRHRGLTQSQVLDRLAIMDDPNLPKTGASLSRLEAGKQPYSQRVLEALAEVYNCEPGDLIKHNPEKEGRIIDIVARLDAKKRDQALAILEALANTAA